MWFIKMYWISEDTEINKEFIHAHNESCAFVPKLDLTHQLIIEQNSKGENKHFLDKLNT